jgi:uncharacterized protein YndB with AHSA1/START domain
VSSKVLVSLRVKASPDRAFAAFVDDIGAWWQASPLFAFTPRDPGVLAFEPGEGGRLVTTLPSGLVFEIGKIRAWDPPRRLVCGWRQAAFTPDQDTEVEVRFELVGDETRVTVEHRGWDTVPAEHVARHGFPNALFLTRHGEWWQRLLASYKAELARPTLGGEG